MRDWRFLGVLVLALTVLRSTDAARPYFKKDLFGLRLKEDIPIGSTVGTLVANDFGDTRKNAVYDVESDKFAVIDKASGNVRLLKSLDREHDLGGVQVKEIAIFYDTNPPERIERVVTIRVEDVNDNTPEFTIKQFKYLVSEDAPIGTKVAENVEITDADISNADLEVKCIKEKAEIARSCELFTVKKIRNSNQDWYGDIILNELLDFEDQALWQLPLEVYDGELTLSQTIEILVQDIQDSPPQWLDTYSVTVNESIPIGSYIETVKAEDGDRGVPRPIIYRISRNVGPGDGWFKINEITGRVTTNIVLDRDDPLLAAGFVSIRVQAIEVIDAANGVYGNVEKTDMTTTSVTVTVLDLNDHQPRWVIPNPSVDVREDIASGRPVPGLLATVIDEDQGELAFHNIIQMDHTKTFSFSPVNGTSQTIIAFKVIQPLDYERFTNSEPKYVIRLIAREISPQRYSSTGTVTINVLDVNDNQPQFTKVQNYQIAISEVTPIGTSVLQVEASDADSGDLGKQGIRYSLINNGAEKFRMDPITGILTVANCAPDKPGEGICIDYEKESLYRLTVLAEDELGKGRRDNRGIDVNITDSNDNRPKCRQDKYVGYIREGQTDPDPPLQILARDLDSSASENNVIHYAVIGNTQFKIYKNGTIKAISPVHLDQTGKVVDMQIEVNDSVGGMICLAQLNIIDVNDHTPIFSSNGFYNVSIYETSPPGTSVVDVDAEDSDPVDSVNGQLASYRIVNSSLVNFRIEPTTGLIEVAQGATFDYDVQTEYHLTVIAPDRGIPQNTGTASVIVNILDKNNKSPYFVPNVQRITVWENTTVNTFVVGLIAKDPDPGAKLEYSWAEPITAFDKRRNPIRAADYNFKDLFSLDKNDGTVRVAKLLDYDKVAEIKLTVHARDITADEEQIGIGTLNINILDINEDPPTFARPWTPALPDYVINVKEEQPVPSFVMTAVASDPNSPISAYVLSKNDENYFRISKFTGVVESIKRLDYEQIQRLDFVVTAYDFGVPVLSATANVRVNIININDMTPQFGKDDYQVTIDENSPAGTDVITVTATDGDSGDYGVVSYRLAANSDQFEIDSNTGEITVKQGAVLDRELTPYITIQVTAEDSPKDPTVRNRNSVPVYITLRDVNDHVPAFINDDYFAEIIENTPVGTSLLRVRATDGDKSCNCPNAFLAYTKLSGDTDGYFTVKRESGLIAVAKSVLSQDYDHKFIVQVNDVNGTGPVPRQARVTIRVVKTNNKPPVWVIPPENNMTIDVLENQYLGMEVYQVLARDVEAGDRGFVSYYFRHENQNVDRTPEFRINEITGIIHARQIYDREAISIYRLYVVASDKGNPPFNSTRILTVRIRDVDDNKPEFPRGPDGSVIPYNFMVPENAGKDTYIGSVQATDRDSAEFGKIFYSIISGNTDNAFRVGTKDNRGELFTNKEIDRETAGFYNLEIRASNNASEQYLITRRRKRALDPSAVGIRITVSDANDNIPTFVQKVYQTCTSSDDPFGKSLVTVSATDLDTGESGAIRYTISSSDNVIPGRRNSVPGAFVVGETNGTLYSNTLFTQYKNTYFDLALVASNPNSPVGQTGKSQVQVFVTNPLDMVKVTAHRGPEEVNRYIRDYKTVLSEAMNGGIICIDDVRYHLGEAVEIDKSDIYIHVINKDTKLSVSALDVAAQLQAAKADNAKGADFSNLFIEDIGVVQTGMERIEIHPVFILTMIILVIIICACVVLCVVCFFIRRSYKKEMERAKYIHEEPLFANGASVNPLWKEKPEEKNSQGFNNRAFVDDEISKPPQIEVTPAPVENAPALSAPPASGAAPPPPPVSGAPPAAPPPPPVKS